MMIHECRARQLRLRCRTEKLNLFARLSPSLAQDLLQEARETSIATSGPPAAGWHASNVPSFESESDSWVSFLPLEISMPGGSKIYVSYNGGTIDDDDAIELPEHSVPTALVGDKVQVIVLPYIHNLEKVTVYPVTTKDWELMELYSEFLESGAFLDQVSVVYPDQLLNLDVGSSNYVTLRVESSFEGCGRLVADTEVVVVPKPRNRPPTPSMPLRLVGTSDDWSEAMRQLAAQMNIALLEVSPGCVLIHPRTLETMVPGWEDYESECRYAIAWRANDTTDSERAATIVMIEASEAIDEDVVALHVLNRYTIEACPLVDKVCIKLLPLWSIERARRCEAERAVVSFDVRELHVTWKEEEPWKPWKYVDNFDFPEFEIPPASFSSQNPTEVLLTRDSVFFCPRTNSLARLCSNASGGIVTDHADPLLVVTLEEALREHVIDSLPWNPPPSEIHLASMSPTGHCVSAIDGTFSDSLLVQRDLFDAWFIHGDTGTGKTHYALVLAATARMKWGMPTFYLDCKTLQSASDLRMNSMLQELTAVFRQAMESQPSLLILDDLDFLVPNQSDGEISNGSISLRQVNPIAVDQTKLLVNHLQSLMDCCVSNVIFVITCRSSVSLPPEIAESLACHTTVDMESLSLVERTKLISSMLDDDTSDLVCLVSILSDGYRAKDLRVIATRINHARPGTDDSKDYVQLIMDEYVPLSRQGLLVETGSEHQSWNEVGGIFVAKEKLKTTILNPTKYRKIYEKAPIKLPKGILLFGPPGCGKSYLVPALAKECGHTLITCRGPELLDRYIGASEANVRKLFERARSAAPAILFLDEFDALAPRRGSDNTGVTDRVVNQLLTYLDGVETTLENVFLIAATSRPEKIDPALLRPGRLEQHIYVGFPESSDEVIDVLQRMMAQRQSASSILRSFQAGALVLTSDESNHLAQLSPADMKAVLDSAHLEAIHEHLASCRTEPVVILEHHFRKALLLTRASVSEQDRAMFAEVHQPFLAPSHTSYAKESRKGALKTSLK